MTLHPIPTKREPSKPARAGDSPRWQTEGDSLPTSSRAISLYAAIITLFCIGLAAFP